LRVHAKYPPGACRHRFIQTAPSEELLALDADAIAARIVASVLPEKGGKDRPRPSTNGCYAGVLALLIRDGSSSRRQR
jgi:hypothetical protein